MSTVHGFSHVAVITADLDRYLRFYCDVLGLEHQCTMQMDHDPGLRHAFVAVEPGCVLHVFEQPGYDPVAAGIPDELGRRGRVDHFGLMVADVEALEELRGRLVAAGASDGTVTAFGPVFSVHFVDPDGLHAEVNCPTPVFTLDERYADTMVEVANPRWFEDVSAKVAVAGSPERVEASV